MDLIKLKTELSEPDSLKECLENFTRAKYVLELAREVVKNAELGIIDFMSKEKIYEIEYGNGDKLVKGKKKTNRFETEAILKELNFTEEQISILPKNPAFKKKAVLANEKISDLFYEEVSDKIELKKINPELIKLMTGGK